MGYEPTTSSRTVLTMTTTSLHNVIISSRSDHIFYEVTTPPWEPDITKVKRRDPEIGQFDLVGEIKLDLNWDEEGDSASDDTRIGRGGGAKGKGKRKRKIDKRNRKAEEDGEVVEKGETMVGRKGKRKSRHLEVRVWGRLYKGVEEWLPRAEGSDRVYGPSRLIRWFMAYSPWMVTLCYRTGRFESTDGTIFLWRKGHDCELEVSCFPKEPFFVYA